MLYISAVSMLMQLTPALLRKGFSVQRILNRLTSCCLRVHQQVLRVRVKFSVQVLQTIFSTKFLFVRRCRCRTRSTRTSAMMLTTQDRTLPYVVFYMKTLNFGSDFRASPSDQYRSPTTSKQKPTLNRWEQKGLPCVSQIRMLIYFLSRSQNRMDSLSSCFYLLYFWWMLASYFFRLWSVPLPSTLLIIYSLRLTFGSSTSLPE